MDLGEPDRGGLGLTIGGRRTPRPANLKPRWGALPWFPQDLFSGRPAIRWRPGRAHHLQAVPNLSAAFLPQVSNLLFSVGPRSAWCAWANTQYRRVQCFLLRHQSPNLTVVTCAVMTPLKTCAKSAFFGNELIRPLRCGRRMAVCERRSQTVCERRVRLLRARYLRDGLQFDHNQRCDMWIWANQLSRI